MTTTVSGRGERDRKGLVGQDPHPESLSTGRGPRRGRTGRKRVCQRQTQQGTYVKGETPDGGTSINELLLSLTRNLSVLSGSRSEGSNGPTSLELHLTVLTYTSGRRGLTLNRVNRLEDKGEDIFFRK